MMAKARTPMMEMAAGISIRRWGVIFTAETTDPGTMPRWGKKTVATEKAQKSGAYGGDMGQDERQKQGFPGLLAKLGNPLCHEGDNEKGNHKPDVLPQHKSKAG
jgi:hypothetical protein